jgi:hypothetical protein
MKKKNRLTAAAVTAAYIAAGIMAVFAATVIVSCATARPPLVMRDKGSIDKIPAPEWYTVSRTGSGEGRGGILAVEALPAFKDQYCFIGTQQSTDLEFCLAWARQFSVQEQIAEMVRSNVVGQLSAEQAGQSEGRLSAGMADKIKNFVTQELNTSFGGARRIDDWWVYVREYDPDRKGVYQDYYEAFVLYAADRRLLNLAIGGNMKTALDKDDELYQITVDLARKIMLGDGAEYNFRDTPASVPTATPAAASQAGTGKISIFSQNAPSDFISLVRIFKGTETRGEPYLTHDKPIRPESKAEWDLPEGEYTIALYYNNSERAWGQARVSVKAGDVLTADVNINWLSFVFKK